MSDYNQDDEIMTDLKLQLANILKLISTIENTNNQNIARGFIPIEKLKANVQQEIRQYLSYKLISPMMYSLYYKKLLLVQLMKWFKSDFFKKFIIPNCPNCNTITYTLNTEYPEDNSSIIAIEKFKCRQCAWNFSFTRFMDAKQLLLTRVGLSSEWTQVFCLMCRALGMRTRYVFDLNDHTWAEIYMDFEQRWVHCDPLEGVLDEPLIYERHFKKRMVLVIGVSKYEAQDVTWRYSGYHSLVQSRRPKNFDSKFLDCILHFRKNLQRNVPVYIKKYLMRSLIKELVELMIEPKPGEQKPDIKVRLPGLTCDSVLYYVKPPTAYVWVPSLSEIINKEINIYYYITQNYYSRTSHINDVHQIGWQTCAYDIHNVSRCLNDDENRVYLSNADETLTGSITWCISLVDTDLKFHEVGINIPTHEELTGTIKMELYNHDMCITIFNRAAYTSKVIRNSRILYFKINLLGAKGNGWDTPRLFQKYMDDWEYALHLRIKLKY